MRRKANESAGCDPIDLEVVRPAPALVEPHGVRRVQAIRGQRLVQVMQRAFERSLQEELPIQAVLEAPQRLCLSLQPIGARNKVGARREEVRLEQAREQIFLRQILRRRDSLIPMHPVANEATVQHCAHVVGRQLAAVGIDQREPGGDELRLWVGEEHIAAFANARRVEQVVRVEQRDEWRRDGLQRSEHRVAEAQIALVDAHLEAIVGQQSRLLHRVIRRSIVDDQHLDRRVILRKHAADRVHDERGVAVGRDQDRYVWLTLLGRGLRLAHHERRLARLARDEPEALGPRPSIRRQVKPVGKRRVLLAERRPRLGICIGLAQRAHRSLAPAIERDAMAQDSEGRMRTQQCVSVAILQHPESPAANRCRMALSKQQPEPPCASRRIGEPLVVERRERHTSQSRAFLTIAHSSLGTRLQQREHVAIQPFERTFVDGDGSSGAREPVPAAVDRCAHDAEVFDRQARERNLRAPALDAERERSDRRRGARVRNCLEVEPLCWRQHEAGSQRRAQRVREAPRGLEFGDLPVRQVDLDVCDGQPIQGQRGLRRIADAEQPQRNGRHVRTAAQRSNRIAPVGCDERLHAFEGDRGQPLRFHRQGSARCRRPWCAGQREAEHEALQPSAAWVDRESPVVPHHRRIGNEAGRARPDTGLTVRSWQPSTGERGAQLRERSAFAHFCHGVID